MLQRIVRTTLVAAACIAPMVVAAGAALATPTAAANAQVSRRSSRYQAGPDYWVGLSIGYQDGFSVFDGNTEANWKFGYTEQIRATLEKTLQPGTTLGISAGFSSAPMTYTVGVNDPNSLACLVQCQATGDITQYMAFLHGGSVGLGFHWTYDLEGGFTEFSNFKTKDGDVRIGPADAKYDFSFGLGGGVGYGFSRDADVYVTQIFDWVLHPQGDNNGGAPHLPILRAGFRIGF